MFYAALDVSLRTVAICIIDQAGNVRLERSTSSELVDLIRCLQDFGQPIHQVGLEAGNLSITSPRAWPRSATTWCAWRRAR